MQADIIDVIHALGLQKHSLHGETIRKQLEWPYKTNYKQENIPVRVCS